MGFIESSVFKQKIKEYQSSESWVYKTIYSDLSSFSKEDFSVFHLEKAFEEEFSDPNQQISLVSIKNNIPKILTGNNRQWLGPEKVLFNTLKYFCRSRKMPNVVFLFSSHDFYDTRKAPVLTFSKLKGGSSILMPDFEALDGYKELRNAIKKGVNQYPWSAKNPILFWRGSTTGGIFSTTNYLQFPRSSVVLYSLMHPEQLDARFTNIVQSTSGVQELLHQQGMIGNPLNPTDSLKYKYLIDVDGNASTYSRAFWILLSNSVLCKVSSEYTQWYYSLLSENQNYISISSDLSDLESKLNWLKEHDEAARQIALNATKIVEDHLSQEAVRAYFFCLIDAIASIQKN